MNKIIKLINVSEGFSKYPAGRYTEDGDYSAEKFRETLLVPYLLDEDIEKVMVELDGVAGYSSSFLEEAFGGLVRTKKFNKEILNYKLELKSSDKNLIAEIKQYIKEA